MTAIVIYRRRSFSAIWSSWDLLEYDILCSLTSYLTRARARKKKCERFELEKRYVYGTRRKAALQKIPERRLKSLSQAHITHDVRHATEAKAYVCP
jgi:hypothetical protein